MPDNVSIDPPAARATIRFRALGVLDLQRVGGGELRALIVQPKRLALFAYLALARPTRLHRRDSLLALFWPESTDEQARRSLRQALHFIRQSLGGDVLTSRGDEEIGVHVATVWCDVHEFERAIAEARPEDAIALYRGRLLEGFHVSGVASELGQWLEDERARLHARAVEAARLLADRAEREGNAALAVTRLRELLQLEPGAEAVLQRLMRWLDRSGDRAGALRAYDEFARRLESDVGAEPTSASVALAERIRAGRTSGAQALAASAATRTYTPPAPTRAVAVPRPTPPYVPAPFTPETAPSPVEARPSTPRGVRARTGLALLVVAASVGGVLLWRDRARDAAPGAPLVLAVGAIEDRAGGDSSGTANVLRDLLATDLARVPGVAVVGHVRMQELLLRTRDSGHAAVMRAAAGAGAREVLEGELHRRSAATLRLDVRRIDVDRGTTRGAYSVEGPDPFMLAERLSEALATELGQRVPAAGGAREATSSLAAWRLYGEGRRAVALGDMTSALRLLEAALAEDSSFALAALWASRVAGVVAGERQLTLVAQAARASRQASPRDRLRIRIAWAMATNDLASVALADSLARLDRSDLEAQLTLAEALGLAGEYRRALPVLHDIVARDSIDASRAPDDAVCTACIALSHLAFVYTALDSADGAERVLRTWARLRPRAAQPWEALGITLAALGRSRDAQRAWERWQALAPWTTELRLQRVQFALRLGEFAEADRLLADLARDGTQRLRSEAYWWQVISLRMQGRLDAAMQAALRHAALNREVTGTLPQAQVLLEIGRGYESARIFEVHARRSCELLRARVPAGAPDAAPGLCGRALSWPLTLASNGHALMRDTGRLAVLADSIERLGARELLGRDRSLHHHVRGLLEIARGRPDEAIGEFRRAIVSPTMGYTRSNLELGRLLTMRGRPREAIAVLEPALHGDLQSSNYYVTHTELHEALAEAWEAAGVAESARVHWRWVATAWSGSDRQFRDRAARASAKAGGQPLPRRAP